MNGPSIRQVRFARRLGIDVSPCRNVWEARRAISLVIYQREIKIAGEKGIRPGVLVSGRYGDDPAGHFGRVRYVRLTREIYDGGTPLVVAVDWVKPRKHFSRSRASTLTVIKDGG